MVDPVSHIQRKSKNAGKHITNIPLHSQLNSQEKKGISPGPRNKEELKAREANMLATLWLLWGILVFVCVFPFY